jgi:hypothetical protein
MGQSLYLRLTSASHGTIEPETVTTLPAFQADLAATRDTWVIDEN